jgi:glyoxylase-like metal-dependent hydrolase (beta-lactamase superfamily II)
LNLNNPSGSSGTTGGSCLTSIVTKPKFAIGQRAILVRTPRGNVLWDCVTYLDEATAAEIQRLGGLKAIVISHPHFYSAHLEWAERFDCPVYLSAEDKEWLARRSDKRQVFLDQTENRIEIDGQDSGVRAIKLGGHFPGSCTSPFPYPLFS